MDIVNVWNQINTYFHLKYFDISCNSSVYTVDVIVEYSDLSSAATNEIGASGSHFDKEIALTKALSELVERSVFLLPFKGPVECMGDHFYAESLQKTFVNLKAVIPELSPEKQFSSKGYACHSSLRNSSEAALFEYYENQITTQFNEIIKDTHHTSNITELRSHVNDAIRRLPQGYRFLVIKFIDFYYTVCQSNTEYTTGVACHSDLVTAIYSAYFEAHAKVPSQRLN